MRSPLLFSFLLTLLATLTLASSWSKEDQEIFRIRDELELAEGAGTTFYQFLEVPRGPRASQDDISRAFKTTSRKYHPDKHRPAPGLSASATQESHRLASERYARLGIVANILRGKERARYDHFLKNGFPKWRGTGYYYARFRPGLGLVLVGLWGGVCAVDYAVRKLTVRGHRRHVGKLVREARGAAWGKDARLYDVVEEESEREAEEEVVPRNRKERRKALRLNDKQPLPARTVAGPMEKGLQRRKVYLPSGQQFVVDADGTVWLLDGEEELEVSEGMVEDVGVRDTALVKVPVWFWNVTLGRVLGKVGGEKVQVEEVEGSEESEEEVVKKGAPKKIDGAVGGARRRVKEKRQKK